MNAIKELNTKFGKEVIRKDHEVIFDGMLMMDGWLMEKIVKAWIKIGGGRLIVQ